MRKESDKISKSNSELSGQLLSLKKQYSARPPESQAPALV